MCVRALKIGFRYTPFVMGFPVLTVGIDADDAGAGEA